MKITVTIVRILTGLLFIFSGLVKAIDPKGLAYKMQEFFEAWGNGGFMPGVMRKLEEFQLPFAIIMITLEIAVGIALLIGFKKRITVWILVLLMLFFTFLTAYVLFTGKIKACGCFGDCIPLTPIQTFTKDIILLLASFFLLIFNRYITPLAKPLISLLYLLLAIVLVLFLQRHVLRSLPVIDCLPYKKGNNILDLRKMPANAVADKFDYLFVYEKDGIEKEFKADAIPDSTWKFVDRKQILVEKGSNNVPLINDFSLTTKIGNDSTEAILNTKGEYFLLFIKDLENYPANWNGDIKLITSLVKSDKKIYIVSSQPEKIKKLFQDKNLPVLPEILSCDATVIKTIARVNPTLYLMNGPVVKYKWAWTNFDEAN
jgi:uncharacterized membrane protein YphA (DoxX/SURF4 family)